MDKNQAGTIEINKSGWIVHDINANLYYANNSISDHDDEWLTRDISHAKLFNSIEEADSRFKESWWYPNHKSNFEFIYINMKITYKIGETVNHIEIDNESSHSE